MNGCSRSSSCPFVACTNVTSRLRSPALIGTLISQSVFAWMSAPVIVWRIGFCFIFS